MKNTKNNKDQAQQAAAPVTLRLINGLKKLQLHNFVFFAIFFAFRLLFGLGVGFYLSNISFTFQLSQFSISKSGGGVCSFVWVRRGDPSGAWHDMEDKELLWRASMVPRVPKLSFNRVSKVAFMLLTIGPLSLAPLWELFFKGAQDGLYTIYIHSMPSYFNEIAMTASPDFPVDSFAGWEIEFQSADNSSAFRLKLFDAFEGSSTSPPSQLI